MSQTAKPEHALRPDGISNLSALQNDRTNCFGPALMRIAGGAKKQKRTQYIPINIK